MKRFLWTTLAAIPAVLLGLTASPAQDKDKEKPKEEAPVYPVALLGFEERGTGAKDLGFFLVLVLGR